MTRIQAVSRRGVLIGLSAVVTSPNAVAEEPSLAFLVVGDWGERSNEQAAVAAAMGRIGAEIGSQFVISTGDNFYEGGVASVEDEQWTETFEQVFSASSLQTPWYSVLGNHDYRGSVRAEMDYTIRSPRWRMPSRYWSQDFRFGSDLASFFFLDTFPLTHLPELRSRVPIVGDREDANEQLHWLERSLSACVAPWKIVVGHHPLYSSGEHGGEPALRAHLEPLFERFGVQVYLNGHDHDLEHLTMRTVDYVCSGGGSEARPIRRRLPASRFAHGQAGFASCVLSSDRLRLRFHDREGVTIYSVQTPR